MQSNDPVRGAVRLDGLAAGGLFLRFQDQAGSDRHHQGNEGAAVPGEGGCDQGGVRKNHIINPK